MTDAEAPLLMTDRDSNAVQPNQPGGPAPAAAAEVKEENRADSSDSGSKAAEEKVTPRQMFRFASGADHALMAIGTVGATINGFGMPAFSYLFGRLVKDLSETPDDLDKWAFYMAMAGVILMFGAGAQMAAWTFAGERQADKMRASYFTALLQQEPGWHDGEKVGTLTTRLHGDTHVIHAGIGEKMGLFIQNFAMVIGAYIVGFIASWRLSLIILSTSPLIAFGGWLMTYSVSVLSEKSRASYSEAGAVAEETLSSIRTVYAFNAQEETCRKYGETLLPALVAGKKRGFAQGAGIGFTNFVIFSTYGIAFYYAAFLVQRNLADVGDILTCFFSVLMGSFAMGQAAAPLAAFSSARAAAKKVYAICDRQPKIVSGSRTIPGLRGEIELRGVGFRYPTRQAHWVFRDLNLRIPAGQVVALVGASGCGKSSVVGMLQRFYDPEEGLLLIDGVPLHELDLEWWRNQVGIVTQEPVLFSGTIAENVRMGLGGEWSSGDPISDEDMEKVKKACIDAQIHDIIVQRFPDGYDTKVGEGGGKLSGGQKQRVAIARAIVKDPRLLLLDEATSALDRRHEAEVQRALNRAMTDRTTVIVAHRLTTIRHAHNIVVIRPPGRKRPGSVMMRRASSNAPGAPEVVETVADGAVFSKIAEQGTHDQLLAMDGHYAQLFRSQMSGRNRSEVLEHTEEAEAAEEDSALPSPGASPLSGREDQAAAEEQSTKKSSGGIGRVAGMSRPWLGWIVLGIFGAFLNGLIYPSYAIIFTKCVNIFANNVDDAQDKALVWAIMFVGIGLLGFVGYTLQYGCFAVAGEELTITVRRNLFRHMLRQDLSFYDEPGHESGALAALLAGKAEVIYKLFGPSIGLIFQLLSTLVVGFTISFYVSWELTLVILSAVPVMGLAGFLNMKIFGGEGFEDSGKDGGRAGRLTSEALSNIKTVLAFNSQYQFQRDFQKLIDARRQRTLRKTIIVGGFFGFSQFVMFGAFALALWYGGKMINNGRMPDSDPLELHDTAFGGVMLVTMAVVLSAMGIGEAVGLQGSGMDAGDASKEVFSVLDTEPKIDQMKDEKDDGGVTQGALEFHGVHFNYPTRPDVKVLDGLDLDISARRSTALIGDTGCGKSTVIQLLLRFYDPAAGAVTVDQRDIRDLNLRYWRDQVGLVGQEPVLFSGTVADNIRLGRPNATQEEVIEASKRAHVHGFISAMPDGYDTRVGQKGSQLSGGQKQRVAIARALIKKPRVLLLDEATSALDNTSEREVQGALDSIVRDGGMTTVEIAHRMTTIEGADTIAVLQRGTVLEKGSHSELMKLDGDYKSRYDLYHSLE
eukprot:TRINITY_DN1701_c7_g1_i1.p1 TRINITY_DN1701_c7_g1~~TRINITY_DN1701_c7_g1_i1.p1  ORF type:complete len:1312 (+),score=406.83 TRINITY_DN1701_c7_g1_i1:95-4030(+)